MPPTVAVVRNSRRRIARPSIRRSANRGPDYSRRPGRGLMSYHLSRRRTLREGSDLARLAGTWNGIVTPPSGGGGIMPAEGRLTLSPDGDYVFEVGAIVSRGKAEIKDGTL